MKPSPKPLVIYHHSNVYTVHQLTFDICIAQEKMLEFSNYKMYICNKRDSGKNIFCCTQPTKAKLTLVSIIMQNFMQDFIIFVS